MSSERKIRSQSSTKQGEKANTKHDKPWRNNIRISGLRKANKYTSRNRKKPLLKKNKTEKVFSTQTSKDGFFLTSVEDNNFESGNKENQPQSEINKEKEKPMFESINKKGVRKSRIRKIKHSYANLGNNQRLPSVNRNGAKTSLDYLPKTSRVSRNPGFSRTQRTTFGYQSTRSNLSKGRRVIKPKKTKIYMTKEDFKSMLEKYKTEVKQNLDKQ